MYNWDDLGWAAEFSVNYPNVRTLEVIEGSSEWVTEFGGRIDCLRLTFPPDISFIENNCPSLRHIKLRWSEGYEDEVAGSIFGTRSARV